VRLAQRLDGRVALLTGVTGFVGEALLHRLLREVPGLDLYVLVRPKGSLDGGARMLALLRKPIFAEVVEAAGGAEELLGQRIHVLDGDLAAVPELPERLDIVVHCAGDVSFDPPISEAFETNVAGTDRLLARVAALPGDVHYVHISTAYVAGRRRGAVAERAVRHDADWRAEAHWGLALRDYLEAESRSPRLLGKLRAAGERAHRRAGLLTAAADTERRRREWVDKQLVQAGTERARSLGWTDAYTFTKALGERVVEDYASALRCSIVRPSIIESALRTPYPGWIEGFKMAEPLILAYGRGELPEFPASPDGVVDIVPVDAVVGAVVAAMAERPPVGQPAYFHVCSGARNPLTFRRLYNIVRGYYERHPFIAGDRGAVRLPAWRFVGGESVERLLATSERAHRAADFLVTGAPRGDRVRELARRLDERQQELVFLRRYVDLYTEYAQAELHFIDDATVALHERLDPADRELFDFDTAPMSW
jgi:fatty acyl-CoA reductase